MAISLGSNFELNTALPIDTRMVVADTTARDAIDSLVRFEGMVVFTLADGKSWQLVGGTTNGDWKAFGKGGGGGGGSIAWLPDVNAPLSIVENAQQVWEYVAGGAQVLYTSIRVSQGYEAGTQIKMNLLFYSDGTSGTILLQSTATLIRPGTDAITSTTNQRVSTNAAVTVSAGTVNEPQEVELDLTSATATINGTAVSPGDLILISLARATDTSSASAKLLPYSAEVIST